MASGLGFGVLEWDSGLNGRIFPSRVKWWGIWEFGLFVSFNWGLEWEWVNYVCCCGFFQWLYMSGYLINGDSNFICIGWWTGFPIQKFSDSSSRIQWVLRLGSENLVQVVDYADFRFVSYFFTCIWLLNRSVYCFNISIFWLFTYLDTAMIHSGSFGLDVTVNVYKPFENWLGDVNSYFMY